MGADSLTLHSLSATAVTLPMKRPLGTSAKSLDNPSILLVDLLTEETDMTAAYATAYAALNRKMFSTGLSSGDFGGATKW
jgi:mandelate racemase